MWVNYETGATVETETDMYRKEAIDQGYYDQAGRIDISVLWERWLNTNEINNQNGSAELLNQALETLLLYDNLKDAKELFLQAYAQWVACEIDPQCQENWDWVEDEKEAI